MTDFGIGPNPSPRVGVVREHTRKLINRYEGTEELRRHGDGGSRGGPCERGETERGRAPPRHRTRAPPPASQHSVASDGRDWRVREGSGRASWVAGIDGSIDNDMGIGRLRIVDDVAH